MSPDLVYFMLNPQLFVFRAVVITPDKPMPHTILGNVHNQDIYLYFSICRFRHSKFQTHNNNWNIKEKTETANFTSKKCVL